MILALAVALVALLFIRNPDSPSGSLALTALGIATGVAIVIFLVWSIKVNGLRATWWPRRVRLHFYNCYLCGFKWTWREDQPRPEANQPANPDLIARGEQNLRNAAAAAAWEQQRRQHNH
jgi:hypothetical protein